MTAAPTADEEAIAKSPGVAEKTEHSYSSPPRKGVKDGSVATNPQQGMSDQAPATASVSANTAPTVTNTACTSPLTVTSLEAAAASTASERGVPDVAVVPGASDASALDAMANLTLDPKSNPPPLPQAQARAVCPPMMQQPPVPMKKQGLFPQNRTPPTEHDSRKLFVGGLPTDGTCTMNVVGEGFLTSTIFSFALHQKIYPLLSLPR